MIIALVFVKNGCNRMKTGYRCRQTEGEMKCKLYIAEQDRNDSKTNTDDWDTL